jgi:anti-sigma-K factor RskA
MSDIDGHSAFPADELLAAEYALGVLDGPERADAERRVARDRAFGDMVAHWQERFSSWAGEIAEVKPPSEVWQRIVAQLPSQPTPRPSLWQSLKFWRRFALASGALAAACIGALIYFGNVSREPLLVAALEGNGRHAMVATVDPRNAAVLAVPANLVVTGNRVPELWLIVPGKDPQAIGLIDVKKPVSLALSPHQLADATTEAALAISLEPPGGSPTGQPTGPVIAVGPLTKL